MAGAVDPSWEIRPFIGIGTIRFGQPRGDILALLGAPSRTFRKVPFATTDTDAFNAVGLQIYYGPMYQVESVDAVVPSTISFGRISFLDRSVDEVVQELVEHGYKDDSLTFNDVGNSLYQEGGIVKCVTVFPSGYFDLTNPNSPTSRARAAAAAWRRRPTYARLETNWQGDSMKNIHFFAVKEDLLALLELVDNKGPLKYALTGNFRKHELKEGISAFDSGAMIPNLGQASTDSSTNCQHFLVCEREQPINLRHLQGIDEAERICVDQLANPDSVIILPGGIWNDDIVIQGHIGTASDSQISQALMKRFQAAITKTFTKVKAFYVGPKALELLESDKRLTSSAQSPREYDLSRT